MKYHLTLITKHQHPESSYEGLHLGTHRIRLTQRFTARLAGVWRVQLSYDANTKVICITPSKTTKGPVSRDTFRLTKDVRAGALIRGSLTFEGEGHKNWQREKAAKPRRHVGVWCCGDDASCRQAATARTGVWCGSRV